MKQEITFHVKMQRLNHVSRNKNTNHIHVAQNIYTNTMTVITKMYLNILVAFHVLNVFFFSTLWIDRNVMTIFELFCVLLTLYFFSVQVFPEWKKRNLFYLRFAHAVFEKTCIVNGECSNGTCTSRCIQQEQTNPF